MVTSLVRKHSNGWHLMARCSILMKYVASFFSSSCEKIIRANIFGVAGMPKSCWRCILSHSQPLVARGRVASWLEPSPRCGCALTHLTLYIWLLLRALSVWLMGHLPLTFNRTSWQRGHNHSLQRCPPQWLLYFSATEPGKGAFRLCAWDPCSVWDVCEQKSWNWELLCSLKASAFKAWSWLCVTVFSRL